eukprot:5591905-Prymnesium_polylepis.1
MKRTCHHYGEPGHTWSLTARCARRRMVRNDERVRLLMGIQVSILVERSWAACTASDSKDTEPELRRLSEAPEPAHGDDDYVELTFERLHRGETRGRGASVLPRKSRNTLGHRVSARRLSPLYEKRRAWLFRRVAARTDSCEERGSWLRPTVFRRVRVALSSHTTKPKHISAFAAHLGLGGTGARAAIRTKRNETRSNALGSGRCPGLDLDEISFGISKMEGNGKSAQPQVEGSHPRLDSTRLS